MVTHVEIQRWGKEVKHYRARIKGTKDFNYETDGETLDKFRGQLMKSLHTGIITHFLPAWNIGEEL